MLEWPQGLRERCDQAFAQDCDDCVGALPFRFRVAYSWRSTPEQARLYTIFQAGGPRAAPPGKSAHEVMRNGIPAALAIDVQLWVTVLVRGKERPYMEWDYDSHPGWLALFHAVKAHPRLHSLVAIGDGDHIEAVNWKARASAAEPFLLAH